MTHVQVSQGLSLQIADLGTKVNGLEEQLSSSGAALDALRKELTAKIDQLAASASDAPAGADAAEVEQLRSKLTAQIDKLEADLKREIDAKSTPEAIEEQLSKFREDVVSAVRSKLSDDLDTKYKESITKMESTMHSALDSSLELLKKEVVRDISEQLNKDS